MKILQVSEDILSVSELKVQASRVLRQLRQHHRPVVVTQNGKAAAVLLSPEEFDRLAELERLTEAVREGLADSAAGRLVSDRDLAAEIDSRYRAPDTE